MSLKSCYVSIPFGIKMDLNTGRKIDFDRIYQLLINPAAQEAGFSVARADGIPFSGVLAFDRRLLEAIIGCDLLIADVTTANPNVMYELGIRHALRRGATLVMRDYMTRPSIDIQSFVYQLNTEGGVDEMEAATARRTLVSAIKEGFGQRSPIFEFFPKLDVDLPENLRAQRWYYPRAIQQKLLRKQTPKQAKSELSEVEETIRSDPRVDPAAILDVLKKYRDQSDWDNVMRFADSLEGEIRESAEVKKICALALNRRDAPGDQDRAIAMMRSVIARSGGDSETHGILGRIYKDRYARTQDRTDLEQAVECYRESYLKQPTDSYAGINLIHLLADVGGKEEEHERDQLIPRVRELVMSRIKDGPADYFDLVAALELAIMSGDWNLAVGMGHRMVAQAPAGWMVDTTLQQLRRLGETMPAGDRATLDRLISDLEPDLSAALENHDA